MILNPITPKISKFGGQIPSHHLVSSELGEVMMVSKSNDKSEYMLHLNTIRMMKFGLDCRIIM